MLLLDTFPLRFATALLSSAGQVPFASFFPFSAKNFELFEMFDIFSKNFKEEALSPAKSSRKFTEEALSPGRTKVLADESRHTANFLYFYYDP